MKMNNTAKLGAILPALLNPATAVIGVGLGLLWLLSSDDDEETDAQADVPTVGVALPDGNKVAATDLTKPRPTVENRPDTVALELCDAAPAAISEAVQKEMIRKTMSELGKRSAAARAKKKTDRGNCVESRHKIVTRSHTHPTNLCGVVGLCQ
jgi:hypothetical protein